MRLFRCFTSCLRANNLVFESKCMYKITNIILFLGMFRIIYMYRFIRKKKIFHFHVVSIFSHQYFQLDLIKDLSNFTPNKLYNSATVSHIIHIKSVKIKKYSNLFNHDLPWCNCLVWNF